MKLKYLIISLLFIGLYSCKKGDSYDLSKVTVFAEFEYEENVAVAQGNSFTPSAVATEGSDNLDVTITGTIDVNTIGVYGFTYSATNSDGYDGTVEQTVVVYDPAGAGTDVSGNINDIGRPERTGVITLVEGTPNVYFCTDMAFSGVFPLYFQMNGDVMEVIPQPFIFGVTQVNATYNPVDQTYHIEIVDYGFTYDFEYTN